MNELWVWSIGGIRGWGGWAKYPRRGESRYGATFSPTNPMWASLGSNSTSAVSGWRINERGVERPRDL